MAAVSPTVIGITTQADIPWRATVATTAVLIGLVALKIVPELEARPEPDHADSKIICAVLITSETSKSWWAARNKSQFVAMHYLGGKCEWICEGEFAL